jgi:opacity protein-like surface antigen
MKKILMLVMATAIFIQSFAENNEKLGIFGDVGFGVGIGGQLYPSSEKDKYLNYGNGFKLDFGARYSLMDNLYGQAEFDMSFGVPKFEVVNKTTVTTNTETLKRNMYSIKISVVPEFEVLELFTMYTGVGIGFFWNSLHFTREQTTPGLNPSEEGKIVSSPALGFTGFLGADFPLAKRITLFGQFGFDVVSFKWKEEVVEDATTTSRIGTHIFRNDDRSNPPPPKVPGSNWQIRAGIRFGIL